MNQADKSPSTGGDSSRNRGKQQNKLPKLTTFSVYGAIRLFVKMLINVFFKEIKVIGIENIPKDGTVIFCGNHANQYIDPCMILAYCQQDISFLVAMKAMRTPIVSWFCEKMRCIAVERPQDLAKNGTGKLIVKSDTIIQGIETQFKKEIHVGDTIKFLGSNIPEQLVELVISDTDLQVKAPGVKTNESEKEYSFKIIPKLDQTNVYQSVIKRLTNGQSIGIFPEGGSHDRSELLPIKAGVSIMALGAMASDPNCKISIIACGLKYFKPHKFRSQVIVEFSRPYEISPELVDLYKKNKRQACGDMLIQVEKKMREVTLNAPSYKELKQIYMAREIYVPKRKHFDGPDLTGDSKKHDHRDYTMEEINEIQKRFAKGLNAFRGNQELQELLEGIDQYMKELKTFSIEDSQVKSVRINFMRIIANILIILPKLLINFVFSFAGLVILTPLGILNRYLAEKARKEALAGSSVKVIGADVMATKKLITTMMLYPVQCLGFTTFFFYILTKFTDLTFFDRVLWAGAFLFFFPLYSYICILARDNLVYYIQLLQSRLMCLFYTENMFQLKQMRKNLKNKIRAMVNKLGPGLIENFGQDRLVKPKVEEGKGAGRKMLSQKSDSSMSLERTYENQPISYYHQIELNNAFESINISENDINQLMEGLDKEFF